MAVCSAVAAMSRRAARAAVERKAEKLAAQYPDRPL